MMTIDTQEALRLLDAAHDAACRLRLIDNDSNAKHMRAYAESYVALRAILTSGEDAWQPIETAPKDGTEVIAWREDAGIFMARWTAPDYFCTERECEELGDSSSVEDWFCADFVAGCRLEIAESPTHWQPLPAPPRLAGKEKADG
jgi:hypothetical protein